MRRDGGTGRRSGLKIRRRQLHGGSTPPPGTIYVLHNQFTIIDLRAPRTRPQSDRVPISGTDLGTVRPLVLNDLEDCDAFMASRRCVQFRLFTLDYGMLSG